MPSRSLSAVLFVLALSLLLPTPALAATEARSSARAEGVLVQLINDRRADAGLPTLTTRADLHGIARDWSFSQAERGQMAHNPNLNSQACCWTRIAENVARSNGHDGDGATSIARALMQLWRNSASHDATMTDSGVDQLGVGIVIDDDGTAWGTAVFRKCDGSSCAGGSQGPAGDTRVSWAPPPPPPPEPEPEPAAEPPPPPEPEPAPATEPPAAPSPSPSPSPPPSPEPSPSPSPTTSPSPTPAASPAVTALRGEASAPTDGPSPLIVIIGWVLAIAAAGATWQQRP